MIEQEKLYGIVVWYNPTIENAGNIYSYIEDIHKLIIIDNSNIDNSNLLHKFDNSKIIYISNKENIGMASALNQGCRFAIESGAEWVLTMDQDSCFFENNLSEFVQNANEYLEFEKVAIFAPVHFDSRNNNKRPVFDNKYSKISYTMTSGNILSLKYLQKAGFFMDKLFIDWIDEEICIRICKLQLQIVQLNSILMEHFVGNGLVKTVQFGKVKYYEEYTPIRYYYITRNLYIVSKLYPSESYRLKKRWRKLVRRMVKYDNQNKLLKIKYVILGFLHYFIGFTGSYNRK